MKELKTKREQLIKEASQINDTIKKENRNFTADEKVKFEKIAADVADLNSRIEADLFLENEKRNDAQKHFSKDEKKLNDSYHVGRAIKNYISNRPQEGAELEAQQEMEREINKTGVERRGGLLIPSAVVNQRATNTQSSQSSLVKANLLDDLSMVQYPVVYKDLGVTVWNGVPNGSFGIPSLANIIASYATTDSTATDIALTSAVKTLAPKWMQGTAAFTKDFLYAATDSMQSQIFNFFSYAIESATDKQLMADLSGNTVFRTGNTSTYLQVLNLRNSIPFSSGFVCSQKGSTFLKTTPTISGTSASMGSAIWTIDGTIDGVPAKSSFLAPNGLYAFGDFRQYHVPIWSNGYELIVDKFTELRKANIILNVSRIQSQGIGNASAFATVTKGSFI